MRLKEEAGIICWVSFSEPVPGEAQEEDRESVWSLQDFVPCRSNGRNGRTDFSTLNNNAVLWLIFILDFVLHLSRLNLMTKGGNYYTVHCVCLVGSSSPPATWVPMPALVWRALFSPSLTMSTLSCPTLMAPHLSPRSSTRTSVLLPKEVCFSRQSVSI